MWWCVASLPEALVNTQCLSAEAVPDPQLAHEVGQVNCPHALRQLQLPASTLKLLITHRVEVPAKSCTKSDTCMMRSSASQFSVSTVVKMPTHASLCGMYVKYMMKCSRTSKPFLRRLIHSPSGTAAEWQVHSAGQHHLSKTRCDEADGKNYTILATGLTWPIICQFPTVVASFSKLIKIMFTKVNNYCS